MKEQDKNIAAEEVGAEETTVPAQTENAATPAAEVSESVEAQTADTQEAAQEAQEGQEEGHELGVAEETYKEMSPLRLVVRRFFRSKLSIVGIVMIVALFLFSFLGPVIYNKWDEAEVDTSGVVSYIEAQTERTDESGNTVLIVEVVEHYATINNLAAPSAEHILGTDDQGMDVFVRLMYGGRISLLIGFIVVILETVIGIVIGGLSGYFGGWVDNVLMRIVDIFNCIPTLPILLIGTAVIDSWHLAPDQQIYVLMILITLFGWSGTARLVRGQILYLREQEYITATEVMGLSTARRIFKHLIPNVMPQLIVSMTLGLGSVILYESTLSYLGLGVQLPKAAWGSMIALADQQTILNYHMNVWLPAGLLIVVAVLGFNFIGDGLRDAMDPKARK